MLALVCIGSIVLIFKEGIPLFKNRQWKELFVVVLIIMGAAGLFFFGKISKESPLMLLTLLSKKIIDSLIKTWLTM